jgi:hypothetical protein
VILGLHEYACVVATSGFIGGHPNNAGIAPGDATKKGIDLCLVSNWPKDTSTTTMFHVGRFKFITAFCAQNGIPAPRIILTEHGFDDVSDVKPWAETLPKTAPYLNARRFKSLVNAWNFLFPQWRNDRARAYFEQVVYLDRYVYQGSPVEAQLLYCWGHTSPDWEQFDIQQEYALHTLLESYAKYLPEPAPAPAPQPRQARMHSGDERADFQPVLLNGKRSSAALQRG